MNKLISMPNEKTTWRQKLRTRIPSWQDYVTSVQKDKRQAIYQLLPLITDPKMRDAIAIAFAFFKPHSKNLTLDDQTSINLQKLKSDGLVEKLPAIPNHQLNSC